MTVALQKQPIAPLPKANKSYPHLSILTTTPRVQKAVGEGLKNARAITLLAKARDVAHEIYTIFGVPQGQEDGFFRLARSIEREVKRHPDAARPKQWFEIKLQPVDADDANPLPESDNAVRVMVLPADSADGLSGNLPPAAVEPFRDAWNRAERPALAVTARTVMIADNTDHSREREILADAQIAQLDALQGRMLVAALAAAGQNLEGQTMLVGLLNRIRAGLGAVVVQVDQLRNAKTAEDRLEISQALRQESRGLIQSLGQGALYAAAVPGQGQLSGVLIAVQRQLRHSGVAAERQVPVVAAVQRVPTILQPATPATSIMASISSAANLTHIILAEARNEPQVQPMSNAPSVPAKPDSLPVSAFGVPIQSFSVAASAPKALLPGMLAVAAFAAVATMAPAQAAASKSVATVSLLGPITHFAKAMPAKKAFFDPWSRMDEKKKIIFARDDGYGPEKPIRFWKSEPLIIKLSTEGKPWRSHIGGGGIGSLPFSKSSDRGALDSKKPKSDFKIAAKGACGGDHCGGNCATCPRSARIASIKSELHAKYG